MHVASEKAGLVLHDPVVPWNADAVLVEALLRLPSVSRRQDDFFLRIAGQQFPADNLRRQEGEEFHRVSFRVPPPGRTVTAEVVFRDRALGQVSLPLLSRTDFLNGLRVQMPVMFARLGDDNVACQTYVSTQCKGLVLSGLVSSPTSLAPLLDLDVKVVLRPARGEPMCTAPVRFSTSQLAGKQALVTVVPKKFPRKIGTWTADWFVEDRGLASQRVRAISARTFQRSLRISDTRFVVRTPDGEVRLARSAGEAADASRLGPCFLVCSREAGMAGVCPVQVRAQVPGSVQPPLLLEQDVLISDGPTVVAPGTLDAGDLAQVTGFELSVKGQALGVLPLLPAPEATFTSEGGFRGAPEFVWSQAADRELSQRLDRLLGGH
jgi:hypothetical protein